MNNIELIERKCIFENHKIITSEISKIQESLFDNELYLDLENEDDKMEYNNIFDAMNYNEFTINYDIKILSMEYYDIKTFTNRLYQLLSKLFDELNISEIFVLLDLKINIFGSLFNKYKPLVKTYKELEKIISKNYYDEAFYLNKLSEEIVDIVFWLVRCSPQMNNIMIFDKIERYYLNICQYGNIHFTGLNGNKISGDIMEKIGFKTIEGRENDNFTYDGKINGRRIKI